MPEPVTPGEMPPSGETPSATIPATPTVAQTGETPSAQPPTWKNGETYDPAEADKALSASRAETNRLKREKEAAEARLKEFEDAQLSEQDRLKKQNEELQAQIKATEQTVRQQRVQLAVERTARELEFVSETAAFRFLDQDAVTFDEAGQPTNVKELLAAVLKDNDYLRKPATDTKPNPILAHPSGGQVGSLTPEQANQAQQQTTRRYASAF